VPGSAEPTSRTLDEIRLLEGSPLFAKATPDQLLHLEDVVREASLAEGAVLFGDSDPPALHFIHDGEVSLEVAGESIVARAGDTLGLLETLAGASVVPARVTVPGRALRLEDDALLELLAEDTGLLQAVFFSLREVEAGSSPDRRSSRRSR
jgi:CRP-like cAMP-binding protein